MYHTKERLLVLSEEPSQLGNTAVAETEGSTPLTPRSATGHGSQPVKSTNTLKTHYIHFNVSFHLYLGLLSGSFSTKFSRYELRDSSTLTTYKPL